MRRFTPVLVAALVVATVAGWGWARAATDCSSSLCVYLPFIQADIQPTEAPTPVRIATPTKTPQGVFIVGQTFSYVDSINYLHIIGEVRNTRSGPVQFVKMTVNIFDSQQRLVATDFTYTYLEY